MASIQETIRAALGDDATLTALVGDKIYPCQIPEDDDPTPWLFYQLPSSANGDTLDNDPDVFAQVEFHAVADDYATAKAIIDALKAVLNGFTGGQVKLALWTDTSEETTEDGYHHAARFDVWGFDGVTLPTNGPTVYITQGSDSWTLVASGHSLILGPDGLTLDGEALVLPEDLDAYALLAAANTFTTGTQTIITGGAGVVGLVVKGVGSQTADLQRWQDNAGNTVAIIKPFGRLVVNQLNADTPDNDLAGASTLFHFQNGGVTKFAAFASGLVLFYNNADFAQTATPCGIVNGNSKVQFLNGTGDVGLVTKDAAGSFTVRTGNPSGSAVTTVHSLQLNPSASPSAGMGAALEFDLKSSTTDSRQAARVAGVWSDPTDASRKGRITLTAFDSSAEREVMRGEADGSAARVGFLGAAAVARPNVTGSRGGNAALASLLTALANLGLITDSTTA